ncbi:UDP-glucose 4-epimerase GalE [Oleiagrimonas sp. C23AA]|uniref:UDP-glucose 4-epimerase GalE n=1 Tax=Oleiagrimonas sp. C23AA TaxID=2719047 RepID=UPI0014200A46|nr:UDP-glucose 4-epimerase GalE [Oleiagrimonas sp. C23AA]NII10581.1 UDP-glucose 4-epimerase GalE [Oleiagrimonas sp. C23AA]
MRVLVTGGAGYIGSHTCVALTEKGFEPVVFDNFCNASPEAIRRVEGIVGRNIPVIEGDVRNRRALLDAIESHGIEAVIHFAALKSVGESVAHPLSYFDNNITGTITLLDAMQGASVHRLVFSSSATVYGQAERVPATEDSALSVTNPYGRTKLVMEQLIGDLCTAQPAFGAMILRYFNPVGAHPSGRIGEDPKGIPNNLMPYIAQVAVGRRDRLGIFGNDWPTADGTGVRDFIHVMDLAHAHVAALRGLDQHKGATVLNIGTGKGTSVLELVRAFESASGRQVPYAFAERRPGDVAELWADPTRAEQVLGWRAEHGIERMCEDTWRWQSAYPEGYA